jgi:hypothetical protein
MNFYLSAVDDQLRHSEGGVMLMIGRVGRRRYGRRHALCDEFG